MPSAPLAQRLRPTTLDDFVGQEHVIGPGPRAAARDRAGPRAVDDPLRAAGQRARRRWRASSRRRPAPSSRSSRRSRRRSRTCARCWRSARERLGTSGRRTILFLDEIHRFNKAQQDALLPGVEEGLADADRRDDREPVLRGQLGAALARRRSTSSSRTRSRRCAASCRAAPPSSAPTSRAEVEELIARRAGGDARNALNILELAVETARAEGVELEDAPRRRRGAQAAARLRQGRRRATTTSSRRGSSRRARATCRRRSTTSPRCSRAARTRASSRGA